MADQTDQERYDQAIASGLIRHGAGGNIEINYDNPIVQQTPRDNVRRKLALLTPEERKAFVAYWKSPNSGAFNRLFSGIPPDIDLLYKKMGFVNGANQNPDASREGQNLQNFQITLGEDKSLLDEVISPGFADNPAQGSTSLAAPDDAKRRAQITAQLQAFTDMLNRPVTDANGNITDPLVKQLAAVGRSQSALGSNARGLQGGAAQTAANAGAQANALPYLQQRQALYGQSLGMLKNDQMTNEAADRGIFELNTGIDKMNNEYQQQAWGNQLAQTQGTGALIGGVAGGVIGAYYGNPAAGAAVGSSAGAGLATLGQGSAPAPKTLSSYGGGQ